MIRLSDRTLSALRGVTTFVVVATAVVVAILAATLYELACDEGCTSSHPIRTWQLVVAIAALAGVIGTINLLYRHHRRAGWALCATTIGLYGLWIILLVLW
jgi:hypothetical protein